MSDPTMIWNAILSIAVGSFVWWMRSLSGRFQNIYDMIGDIKKRIGDTREEIARNYVTKDDAEKDREELMRRFDKVEEKLETLVMKSKT